MADGRGAGRLLAALGGVGLLAFFSFHFGMFHFVHSVFLNGSFRLVEKGEGFPNLFDTLAVALRSYRPLVAAAFISRLPDLRAAGTLLGKDGFSKPYASVVRMHVLIFVFAGLHGASLSRLAIHPVLALYFFPWGPFLRTVRRRPLGNAEMA
jgi:hypothetical protein